MQNNKSAKVVAKDEEGKVHDTIQAKDTYTI